MSIMKIKPSLVVLEEGVEVDPTVRRVDFVGSNVTATQTAPGEIQVSITGGGGSTDSFKTISTPSGTSPIADSATDTLTLLAGSSKVTITGDSTADSVSFDIAQANIDHDALLNFVANEHIDHTTVTLTAGTGLSGGGDISANRTFNLANTAVTPASYGSASQVGTFTVDAQGRLTAASNTSISITASQVSDFTEAVQDAVGPAFTDSSTLDFTYSDAGNSVTASVIEAGLTLNNIGGTLGPTKGGTGITTYSTGDLIYSSATDVLSKLSIGAVGKILRSTGTIATWSTSTYPSSVAAGSILYGSALDTVSALTVGTANQVLTSNGTIPVWGQVSLTAGVTGTLPFGNGGTGATAFTAGSIPYSNGTNFIQANSNFFYDDSTKRLGLNITAPLAPLHIQTGLGTDGLKGQIWGYATDSGNYNVSLKQTVSLLNVRWGFDITDNGTSYTNTLVFDRAKVGVGITSPTAYLHVSPAASTGTVVPELLVSGSSHTALGASVERNVFRIDPGTQQWNAGSLTNQKAVVINQPTVAFTSAATNSVSATVYIAGNPIEGTNCTITDAISLWIDNQGTSPVTNVYGIFCKANQSATGTRYSGHFEGGKFILKDSSTTVGNILTCQTSTNTEFFTVSSTDINCQGTTISGNDTSSGNLTLQSTTNATKGYINLNSVVKVGGTYGIQLQDNSSNAVTINPASSITTHTLTLPGAQGLANSVLLNNGSGTLSWATSSYNVQKYTICGGVNGVGGSVTSGAVMTDAGITNVGFYAKAAGKVTNIAVHLDNSRTAGTLTAKWLKNGVVQSGTVVINTATDRGITSSLSVAYAAGDDIQLQTVTASFTPTGADALITLYFEDT